MERRAQFMVKERDFGLITGNDAKINGYKEITVTTDENIVLDRSGTEVKVKLNTNNFQAPITGTPGKIASFDDNGNIISVDPVAINPDAPIHPKIESYGFIIDMNESNPDSMITYINDNRSFAPARICSRRYTSGWKFAYQSEFSYGDWGNAWFIKNLKLCVLSYNGNVSYEIDKTDYKKKLDGSSSQVTEESLNGNTMVGIPTVWIKIKNLGNNKYQISFSNYKLDNSYHAYAHHDNNGNIMPYTYIAAYTGWIDGSGRLRSLSGKAVPDDTSYTVSSLVTAARKNNPSGVDIWDIEKFVDRNLINMLLMLISRSTNTQVAFGCGNSIGEAYPAVGANRNGILPTGTLDDAGSSWLYDSLFYGEYMASDDEDPKRNLAMKVFGIENWWGNISRLTMGLAYPGSFSGGSFRWFYKLTKGTEDGSGVYGFDINELNNDAGPTGWIDSGISPSGGTYIKTLNIMNDGAMLFDRGGASSTTYFCDAAGTTTFTALAVYGGYAGTSPTFEDPGAFNVTTRPTSSTMASYMIAALSCKPTVTT